MKSPAPAKFRRPPRGRSKVRPIVLPKLRPGRTMGSGRPRGAPTMNRKSAPENAPKPSTRNALENALKTAPKLRASAPTYAPQPAAPRLPVPPPGGGTAKASPSARAMERASANASFKRKSGSLAPPRGGMKLARRNGSGG